ncbi:MAG: bifunctional biotin--[acetyl-CoA-carboxylase] ligase/biotin operon repressor BirA [Candidatus Thiodiazotropha sp. (ex Lucina aurantia)]|uniref:Bifunctional ligase/repressor BirA n=1 Tax=Candidatus Thiodiazotropha endolucinida TaxID=1655433 RepID=A0A7Z0VKV6_9GAMM|nr:bifunctional biotin--[acetyl-CoA-carboxylase] ligase/biotin operon repressor BirA [Candidatus Thiodiazotropha endolucinida]MBT3010479.1 bifunctional biotin--[acetyl-CoA-carboxylase] ligase/biotin operon repressor BirA [Candidatus Thiodiazotropha sp. (ex Lucina pensylvanica)]MBT3016248.1 bifunctional biotin--[acetyl-CoA-carboxylase] ligase/biotin operon repressor BirA [Candidatus Thiodiazotropha taylori]MBT3040163.1 bifunctional biotin--[acetyl-CoA-carboxylase] ligase/biotin operon repressor B
MYRHHDLIHRLADGRFHSGQELGRLLDVTRSSVWKKLKQLKEEYNLEIDAVTGRGYRLREPLDLLNHDAILKLLSDNDNEVPPALVLHASIDSTNSWLMKQAASGAESGTVCLAEQQLAGKGRHGRKWISPFGSNIYFSMLWRFEHPPMQIAGLSLVSAIAVVRLLHELNCDQAGLKWPNDILWQGKKLAGLLLEITGEASGPSQIVIGVGLNTRLGSHGGDIDQPWIDLDAIPNITRPTRNELVCRLIQHLRDVIRQYQSDGMQSFLDEWHRHDLLLGREVEIRSHSQVHAGEHLGIDLNGAIRLRCNGKEQSFHAGEVSLRQLIDERR